MSNESETREERTYNILFMAGVEGDSAYINDYRVAGPKPWGGGRVKWEGKLRLRDLSSAIPELAALEQERDELRAKAALADWFGTSAVEGGDCTRAEELALWMVWVDEKRGANPLDSNMHTDIRAWQARYDSLIQEGK